MNIAEIRNKYPQYDDKSDEELAEGLYNKFYKNSMDRASFNEQIGITPPAAEQPLSDQGNIFDPLASGATFGLADEVGGALMASYGRMAPESMGGRPSNESFAEIYRGVRDVMRENKEAFADRNPKTAIAAEIVGSLPTGIASGTRLAGTKLLQNSGSLMKAIAIGATEGGLYGYGQGEGLQDSLVGGAEGAAVGGVTSGLLGQVLKSFPTKRVYKNSIDEVLEATKQRADDSYAVVNSSKQRLGGINDVVDDITSAMKAEALNKKLDPRAFAALKEIQKLKGGTPKLKELESVRKVLNKVDNPLNKNEGRLANIMRSKLDDFVETTADSSGGTALKTARENSGRALRAEKILGLAEKGGRKKNVGTALRSELRKILDNPKKLRGFGKEEIKLMEEIVQGSKSLDALAMLSPTSLSGIVASAGGLALHPPLGMAVPALGASAKGLSNAKARKGYEGLLREILKDSGKLEADFIAPGILGGLMSKEY